MYTVHSTVVYVPVPATYHQVPPGYTLTPENMAKAVDELSGTRALLLYVWNMVQYCRKSNVQWERVQAMHRRRKFRNLKPEIN